MRLFRYILWIIVAFIIAKMARIILSWRRLGNDDEKKVNIPESSFTTIQDAEFEDITPKSPESNPPQQQ